MRRSIAMAAWRARGRVAAGLLAGLLAAAGVADAAVVLNARLSRSAVTIGESATLDVVVRGASGGISDPEFDLPAGVEMLGSSRSQNFSWINGRSSVETLFRYELGPNAPGRYAIGPIRVRIGSQLYQSEALALLVTDTAPRLGGARGTSGPATLITQVEPVTPYVGQPVILRVRLIQRAPLAEDPQYLPPSTPGFWTEKPGEPQSYTASEGSSRVLVTETRTRLFPITPGPQVVGPASALVTVETSSSPSLRMFGGSSERTLRLRSDSIHVRVRPLPGGAPAGFTGAVGPLSMAWSAELGRTPVDRPVTVRLDLRGPGNLPLTRAPSLEGGDFEVFASTVDDSLGTAGGQGWGRRRFQWTVLPRRPGTLAIAAPAFAWFDPATGTYRRAELSPVRIEVSPSRGGSGEPAERFPTVFIRHPVDPGARRASPAGGAVAGLAIALALILWGASRHAPQGNADHARQRQLLASTARARGEDFWAAADRAAQWLTARGVVLGRLGEEIAAARYGGASADVEGARRRLREQLAGAVPPARPQWPLQLGAVGLLVVAAIALMLSWPRAGDDVGVERALMADRQAAHGEVAAAVTEWRALERESGEHAGLASRLAWAELRGGSIGTATAWVLRGMRGDARDPALAWVAGRVREAGGLIGAPEERVPVRDLEWAVLALLCGLAAGITWPRRRLAVTLAALAVALAVVPGLEAWSREREPRGVAVRPAEIEGTGIELEPGQVVVVRGRRGPGLKVQVGRSIEGVVPAAGIEVVGRRS